MNSRSSESRILARVELLREKRLHGFLLTGNAAGLDYLKQGALTIAGSVLEVWIDDDDDETPSTPRPRFGGSLNLNLHYHFIFLEGVFVDRAAQGLKPRFIQAVPPTDAEIAAVLHKISQRVIRELRQRGYLDSIGNFIFRS